MCRNPVGYLGLLGFFVFKWVKCVYLLFRSCQFKAFCVYVRMGMRGQKCKTPLIFAIFRLVFKFSSLS